MDTLPSSRLTSDLLSIRTAALQAVDPQRAVQRFLNTAARADFANADLFLLAVGKAAAPMAQAAIEWFGSRLKRGILVTKYGHTAGYTFPETFQVCESGHPVPDPAGLAAAQAVESFLAALPPGSHLWVLLSGGASALLPLPEPGLHLEDLQNLTQQLLRSGATIQEINTLRKHLDRLKGGKLARLAAAHATVTTLILSDVVGDPLDVIASGPTVPDPTTFTDCAQILERYHLTQAAPAAVLHFLQAGLAGRQAETPKPGEALFEHVRHAIVGSNRLAAAAAAQEATRLGYAALILTTFVEGEAREAGKWAAALAKGLRWQDTPLRPPACLIWGGETTVTLQGAGQGGRNQELALSAALAMEHVPDVALMALATDGGDGPTDAAGAIVDGETTHRARQLGLDPRHFLDQNDSYPLLKAVNALMFTGPTGTNVNDLLVLLAG